MIKVLPTLQLADPSYNHFFALGDVCDTNENKQAATAQNQVPIVTANIVSLIRESYSLK